MITKFRSFSLLRIIDLEVVCVVWEWKINGNNEISRCVHFYFLIHVFVRPHRFGLITLGHDEIVF